MVEVLYTKNFTFSIKECEKIKIFCKKMFTFIKNMYKIVRRKTKENIEERG